METHTHDEPSDVADYASMSKAQLAEMLRLERQELADDQDHELHDGLIRTLSSLVGDDNDRPAPSDMH